MCWMVYQYYKDQRTAGKDKEDPMAILLHQLTGVGTKKPQKLARFNIYSKEHYDDNIRPKLDAWLTLNPTPNKQILSVRSKITREVFNALNEATRQGYEERAKAAHAEAMMKWKEHLKSRPPRILETSKTIGMQVMLIADGPEPADGGRLNIISTLSFGSTERQGYKAIFIPLFMQYLITFEQCRVRVLPISSEVVTHDLILPSEGILINSVDSNNSNMGGDSVQTCSLTLNTSSFITPIPQPTSDTVFIFTSSLSPSLSIYSSCNAPFYSTGYNGKTPRTPVLDDSETLRMSISDNGKSPGTPASSQTPRMPVLDNGKTLRVPDSGETPGMSTSDNGKSPGTPASDNGRPKCRYTPPSLTPQTLNTFTKTFEKWWKGLQPTWRLGDRGELRRSGGDEWTSLHIFSTNGITSAITALFFWGVYIILKSHEVSVSVMVAGWVAGVYK
ncbi:hypothetical protein HYDPIDRAFT_168197 [Hydnomerulius pinastri MD-312]|uniref:Uncharacterized protein n=1 Tax=Hydnomerulius pinastri MD-312 TaxID=994086 RepID=A0A0C9WEW9_9AGAM|nr:hypothetical protein HYDPIDRAFT_168197 [Hydnomerulius pinastri MD-312]